MLDCGDLIRLTCVTDAGVARVPRFVQFATNVSQMYIKCKNSNSAHVNMFDKRRWDGNKFLPVCH